VQFHRTLPGLAHLERAFARDLTLSAVDAVIKIDAHSVAFFVITDDVCGTVVYHEIFQRKIEFFLAENNLRKVLGIGVILPHWYFGFAVDGQTDGVCGAGNNAHAAVDAFFLVHIHGSPHSDAAVFQLDRHVRESLFGADNRANLAADALIKVPGHQVVARDHGAAYRHLVFVACFLRNTALTHSCSIKYPPAGR